MRDIQFKEEDFLVSYQHQIRSGSTLSTDLILSTFLIKHTLYIYYEC